jgi:uncharacterized RDD family membrane protein YckC
MEGGTRVNFLARLFDWLRISPVAWAIIVVSITGSVYTSEPGSMAAPEDVHVVHGLGTDGVFFHHSQLTLEHQELKERNHEKQAGSANEPMSEFRKSVCIDRKLACVFGKIPLALQMLVGIGFMLLACLLYYLSYGLFERGRIKLGGCVLLLGLCLWTGTGLTFTGWL